MRTTDQNTKKCWRGLGQFLLAARRWLNCTRSKRKTLYRQILQQMEGKLIQTFASASCCFVCCLEKTPTKLISREFPRFSPVRNQFGSECCFLSCNLIGWISFHWSSLRDDKLPTQSEDINKSHWSLKIFRSLGFSFSIEIFQAMHICLNLTVALRWHAENPILFSWLRLLLRLILLWVYFCCEFNFAATFAASLILLRLLLRV